MRLMKLINHRLIHSIAPDATLLNSIAGTSNFEVLKSSVRLSTVFRQFETKKDEYAITDWGISNTSMKCKGEL